MKHNLHRWSAALLLGLLALGTGNTAHARTCGTPPPNTQTPGALSACPLEGDAEAVYCPLEHTDVQVNLSGDIARVTLKQRFRNPLSVPVEALYTFPLSEKGAVDRMTMTIGDRIVVGKVKLREEARADFERARDRGQTAALLDEQRPNIFSQALTNILPGDLIVVEISYVEFLQREAGDYTFAFPMTIGPRYTGGTAATPDSAAITPPTTGSGARPGHDIALEVLLDAGMPLGDVRSELHAIELQRPSESRAIVRLKNQREIPNRDFILRYRVAGEGIREGLLTHRDDRGKFFTLWLQPPDAVEDDEAVGKELVFVIDSSGSMEGFPIEKAKATMRLCIDDLTAKDTFNLVSFAGGTGYCFPALVSATPENKAQTHAYLNQLAGSGGTEMLPALQAALAGPYTPGRLRTVCMMTDGMIGNDREILDFIQRHNEHARLFSFGIGNSVNRFLLENMAREGRGAAEIVTLESASTAAVERFRQRIQRPILTNITVKAEDMSVEFSHDADALPDLFAGQPLRITGRIEGRAEGTIVVRGNTASGPWERRMPVQIPRDAREHDALAALWARERVAALSARDWQGLEDGDTKSALTSAITKLGIDYSLVTPFTSFIAVDPSIRNERGKLKPTVVPNALPDGMTDGVAKQLANLGYSDSAALMSRARMNYAWTAPSAPAPQYRSAPSMEAAPSAPAPVAAEFRDTPEMKRDTAAKPAPGNEVAAPLAPAPTLSATELAKIDPALQGLREKLVHGAYDGNGLSVSANTLQLTVYLNDLSETTLQQVRALGGYIVSTSAASNKALVYLRVDQIERLAQLGAVVRIAPPAG